jgi:hypothetical protein
MLFTRTTLISTAVSRPKSIPNGYRLSVLLLTAALFCAASASAVAAPPGNDAVDVALTVVPAETSIYAGDPLLVKGVLHNRGKTPVVLPNVFNAAWLGVRFELCPLGQTTFDRVRAVGQGSGYVITDGIEVPGGGRLACYEQLYVQKRGEPVRAMVGKWQLRLAVPIGKEFIHSEPVTITVALPPEKIQKALHETRQPIGLCLAFSWGVSD